MKPFYKLHFEDLEGFQEYALSIIKPEDFKLPGLYYHDYIQDLQKHDGFENCIKRYGLYNVIDKVGIFVLPAGDITPIHTDLSEKFNWSFNIPLLNYKNTFTEFYKQREQGFDTVSYSNRVINYKRFFLKDCTLLDRLELTSPYIINTKIPHRIVNETNLTRIVLLIRISKQFDRNRHNSDLYD